MGANIKGIKHMTQHQIRVLLRRTIKRYRFTFDWCKEHKVNPGDVSFFLSRKRNATNAILKALGYEWRIVRKRR